MCKTTNGRARAIRLCCVVLPAEQHVDALVQYRYCSVVLLLFLLHHRPARAEVLDRAVKFGRKGGYLAFLPIRLRRTHTYFSSKRKAQHHVRLGFLLRPLCLSSGSLAIYPTLVVKREKKQVLCWTWFSPEKAGEMMRSCCRAARIPSEVSGGQEHVSRPDTNHLGLALGSVQADRLSPHLPLLERARRARGARLWRGISRLLRAHRDETFTRHPKEQTSHTRCSMRMPMFPFLRQPPDTTCFVGFGGGPTVFISLIAEEE